MNINPSLKHNRFVLVAVVLFNLIWIVLLFLSCQADNNPNPTATPEAGLTWIVTGNVQRDALVEMESINWFQNTPSSEEDLRSIRAMQKV